MKIDEFGHAQKGWRIWILTKVGGKTLVIARAYNLQEILVLLLF
jgi:hypothetical protein